MGRARYDGRGWPSALIGLVVCELVVRYVVLAGDGWAFDDNLYFGLARRFGFGWHWLTMMVLSHWAIGYHAVFSVQIHLMPFDYRWAMALMLGACGLAALLLHRIVARLVGGDLLPALAAMYLGTSLLLVPAVQWWSFGLQGIPTVLADLLCIYAYLRFVEHQDWRWPALAAAALAGGLLFYEKPVFVLLYLTLLRLVMLPSEMLRPRELIALVWHERAFWAALGVVTLVWAYGEHHAGAAVGSSAASPGLGEWLHFVWVFWGLNLLPATFGVSLPWTGLSGLQVAVAVGLQVVVVGVVVGVVLKRRSSWRAWSALLVCVMANAVLLGLQRLAPLGPGIANDPRYAIDFVWLTPVFLALAVAKSKPAGAPPAEVELRRGRGPAVGLLAGAAAYIGLSVGTTIHVQSQWAGRVAREWEHNLSAGTARLRRTSRIVIADQVAPWYMSGDEPYNQISNLVTSYAPGVQVDGPIRGSLLALDALGHPRPVTMQPVRTAQPSSGRCFERASTIALPRRAPPGSLWVLFSYFATERTALTLTYRHGPTYIGPPVVSVPLAPDTHRAIAWLGDGSPPTLTTARTSTACLTRIETVTLTPTAHAES